MQVNRAPNIPVIGLDPNLDLVARLLAPLFLIPRVAFVIKRDTGQNTALAVPVPVPVPVPILVKRLTRGLGPMSYCRPPRPVPIRTFIYARPLPITPRPSIHLKAFTYAHHLPITLLPATTWIRFVIIK